MTALLTYFLSLWGKLSRKTSLLIICGISGLFVNTLTADDKYFFNNENLRQPLQMQLSKKTKLLVNFLIHFSHVHHLLNILEKEITLIADVFPKLQTAKELVKPTSKKCHFRTPFHSQHVKASQTLLESARQKFYHIFSSPWGKLS